jgi:hypothetical protein
MKAHYLRCSSAALAALLLVPAPSVAQDQQQQPGRLAEAAVGEVGQRQTAEQAVANIKPMSRINNRIPNRVQNRIRNRIDRHYDPQANTTSPFEVAADQAEDANSRLRR